MGIVTFVGAGPYGEAYLSIEGKQALLEADCILYDHLLDESMLANCQADLYYVGKQAGHHSHTQEEINALLIEKANQYEHVIRLKGGDSFVFGRGGEEGLALYEHHIPFRFVPGITSAVAVSELAGIPLTHRGIARGVVLLSAYGSNHQFQITANQVSDDTLTIVIYMGTSRVKEIQAVLRQAKRSETTPIAIISQGGSATQQVIMTTCENLVEDANALQPATPAIIVIGDVVRLRDRLAPLSYKQDGRNVFVTKVNEATSDLTKRLMRHGIVAQELQMGTIRQRSFSQACIKNYHVLVFTSQHAIHHFFAQIEDIRDLAPYKFIVMGKKTADALAAYHIKPDFIGDGTRARLLELCTTVTSFSWPTLYIKGANAACITIEGKNLDECIVYENEVVDQPMCNIQNHDLICFGCASSVERIHIPEQIQPCCITIGNTTSEACRKRGWHHIIEAKQATYEAMSQEVIQCIEEDV